MRWQTKNRSEHTFRTYHSGLAYFKPYLEETRDRTAEWPIADLNLDMFHRMAIQAYFGFL